MSTPPLEASVSKKPLMTIDGSDLHLMFSAGYSWLKQHSQLVNALNVFPVPDGDTGTNMVLTMQAAWQEASNRGGASISEVAQAYAQGAIRGARGNSGVILSQILRGFAEAVEGNHTADAVQFASALEQAKETAYKGVLKPVEGTILTVVREAGNASIHAAAIDPDLRFVLRSTVNKARQALLDTPNLLPVLKQAGVVDAGGQGLVYLLEGMLKYLHGEPVLMPDQVTAEMQITSVAHPDLEAFAEEWGYDIQYLIIGQDLDENVIRQALLDLGGHSVVVGGSSELVKIHVHHDNPGPFLTYGASLGHLDDIVLENMTLQTMRRKGLEPERSSPLPSSETDLPRPILNQERDCPGIVAVVSGNGMREVFKSLGICAFVIGGQTMNPSTEELLQAAENLPHDEIILLPNNSNIILAARQAATISRKTIHVIETRSMPHGIAAMLGYLPDNDTAANITSMTRSAQDIHTAEVTRAVRPARFAELDVQVDDYIGLIDGLLCTKGSSLHDVVMQILTRMDSENDTEIFTLYYGEDVEEDEAEELLATLEDSFPDHEIELLPGGQPHYHYLISAE